MPKAVVAPFPTWKKSDAEKEVNKGLFPLYGSNKAFISGDHWQNGSGWIGPRPLPSEDGALEVMNEIANIFTSRNIMAEVVERHTTGLIGRMPWWGLTPRLMNEDGKLDEGQVKEIAEVEAALRVWWNERMVHDVLRAAVAQALWAEEAPVRLFVPGGNLEVTEGGTGVNKPKDLESALRLLYPESLDRNTAKVVIDPETKAEAGIFKFKRDEEDWVELTFLSADVVGTGAPEDAPMTVLKIMGPVGEETVELEMGGRLPMHMISRSAICTIQVQQMQKAFNLALTMVPRAVVTSGFLERLILNGQMPGEWEVDSEGNRIRFIPTTMRVGAGTTNFISGLDYDDDEGKKHLATPEAVYKEPSSITPIAEAKDLHYQDILDETDQAHVTLISSKYASSRSREQARADYRKSLEATQGQADAAGRWVIETALRYAEVFLGTPGKWTDKYRANFTCILDTGIISVEERKANAEEAAAGLMSHFTAMARNGTDDPAAEMSRIESQPEAMIAASKRKAELLGLYTAAGMDLMAAGELSGYSPEEMAKFKAAPIPEPKTTKITRDGTGRATGFQS